MSNQINHYRIANAACGLTAHVEENRIGESEADDLRSGTGVGQRIAEPMKRVNGTLTPVSWDTAIDEIGQALRAVRGRCGPAGIGIYLGEAVQHQPRNLVRSLAFGVGAGTPHIFSEANVVCGPQLWATEQVIGYPASLVSDLSRAHYVVLLSGEQTDLGWGPCGPGIGHEGWLHHSRKTKKTKVMVADPRRTPLAEEMDGHIAIRPGSESHLMLGMLTAVVQRGWTDEQFIRDYTVDFERLKALVSDWSVDDFAAQCGIDGAELSGVALRFARSPMALVHPARQSFQNEAGGLGAWAWLVLHAVTANVLRPGGLFELSGVVDLFPVLSQLESDKAPRTTATDYPLLLMQAPASLVAAEIADGPVRGLVSVNGNPVGRLPNPGRTREALGALDILVCIGHHEDETAQHADWVLPATYPWEEAALALHEAADDSDQQARWEVPIESPASLARPAERILADLYSALRPGMRKSVWGAHWGVFAQYLARSGVEEWEERFMMDWIAKPSDEWIMVVEDAATWTSDEPGKDGTEGRRQLYLGKGDRSLWRPTTEDERIVLVGPAVEALLADFGFADVPELTIRTGQHRRRTTIARSVGAPVPVDARVHPDLGLDDGARVTLETPHGSCTATVVLDDRLRADVVDVPFVEGSPSLNLLGSCADSGLPGVVAMDGLPVRIAAL
ncbi:MAG: molybdopterin-dependent oxidoreductase [Myxococcota bacterium]|nr:molybdopterin-dependent oxidoreductase [Myxococcota bacterium]